MVEIANKSEEKHENSPGKGRISWWFCQGYYSLATGGQVHFVLCFFQVYEPDSPGTVRHHYFYSQLPPNSTERLVRCCVDQQLLEAFQDQLSQDRIDLGGLDRYMTEAVTKEISEYGLPDHFEIREPPYVKKGKHLQIDWDDFKIIWKEEKIDIEFVELHQGDRCRFTLQRTSPPLKPAELGAPRLENSTYTCLPRLSLSGTVGEKEVQGGAWFDHQDTDPSDWELNAGENSEGVIGWEWFAVNFEDGSDWLVVLHRNMKKDEVVDSYAIVCSPGKRPRLLRDITATPLEHWISPVTHIRYPVGWHLKFPEVDAEWSFQPLCNNQEVPMVGPLRAIWEGTGMVKGTRSGRSLSGRGHLELKGYGYIFNFKQYTEVFVERIDDLIEDFLPRRFDEASIERFAGPPVWEYDPEILSETVSVPVWDLLDRGGKHWRPMLGILLLESLGVASKPYESLLANVIELNHTGALIVDDIEDGSLIRRGKECIHLRYGTDVAINTGTALYFLSYLQLESELGLTDRQLVDLYRIVVNFQVKAHLGQGKDIAWTRNMSPQWLEERLKRGFSDKVLQMYSMKTAAATQGTAEAACVIANEGSEVRQAYAAFGRTFGVSFQIVDDVLNFSSSPDWTKTRGEDLLSGKPTWIIVRALERARPRERNRLIRILCAPDLRASSEGLEEGIELIERSGALDEGRRLAGNMLESQWRNFSLYAKPSEAKTMLRMLTTALLSFEQDY
ncbi:MAG: polyprenyl synthetase family protein [Desulfatiglans sp.]|jgi:geranylgeranyl diphosphate synthase type I|nr:polyprenyl synthetase family protein [Thermodesulfobacteriota bacterium]MEE4352244.1 polyprenyl synthetase family protein [Desulfatiglans sp.]